MVEYALLLSLIALALVGTIGGMAGQIGGRFNAISNTLASGGNGGLGPGTTVPNGGGGGTVTPPPTTGTGNNNGNSGGNSGTGNNNGGNNNGSSTTPDTGDSKWNGDHDDLSLPAYAVYCSEDASLEFFRDKGDMPNVGERSRTGKRAGTIYTGFEDTTDSQHPWTTLGSGIKTITFVDRIRPRVLTGWFMNSMSLGALSSVTDIDAAKLDTSRVSDASSLFSGLTHLTSVRGLEDWDTDRFNNIRMMFYNCKSIAYIPGIDKWNVSKVVTMEGMFMYCESLKELNLAKWDVSSLRIAGGLRTSISENMNGAGMFNDCFKLTSVGDISDWNVANLYQAGAMFYNCYQLKVDCSKWSTPEIRSEKATLQAIGFNRNAAGVIVPSGWPSSL